MIEGHAKPTLVLVYGHKKPVHERLATLSLIALTIGNDTIADSATVLALGRYQRSGVGLFKKTPQFEIRTRSRLNPYTGPS